MNDLIESKNKFELLFNQQQNLLELFNIGDLFYSNGTMMNILVLVMFQIIFKIYWDIQKKDF